MLSDGWVDGWIDGLMDGWLDGWADPAAHELSVNGSCLGVSRGFLTFCRSKKRLGVDE